MKLMQYLKINFWVFLLIKLRFQNVINWLDLFIKPYHVLKFVLIEYFSDYKYGVYIYKIVCEL